MSVGVIGIGNMGREVARHLAAANGNVFVWDRRPEAMEIAQSIPGLKAAPSLQTLAEHCETVITVLPDGHVVDAVVREQLAPFLRENSLVIDMSTSAPASTRALYQWCREQGLRFADAPMTGGIYAARAGKLTLFLGADAETVAPATSLLSAVAEHVFHVGSPGSGHVMKALNNMVSLSTLVLTAEAVVLGEKWGLQTADIIDCLNRGSARSYATEVKFPAAILSGTFDTTGTMQMLQKDLEIALGMADQCGASTPIATATHAVWSKALTGLGPTRDQTEIYKFFKDNSQEPDRHP